VEGSSSVPSDSFGFPLPFGLLKLKELTSHRPDDTLRIELEWPDLPSMKPESGKRC
jgi:hypothetical protein